MVHLLIDIQVAGAFSSIFLSQKLTKLQDTQIGHMKIENNAFKQTKQKKILSKKMNTPQWNNRQISNKESDSKEPQISKEL